MDVITNAANNGLKHAGGIAGVIVRAAGQELQYHCDTLTANKQLRDGEVVFTNAYNLTQFK